MKEIGGYIELDTYTGAMLHEKAIALNCGRGALEYLCEAKDDSEVISAVFSLRFCAQISAKK